MNILGHISNNKIFAYKYLFWNIYASFDNFYRFVETKDNLVISDYFRVLYQKMISNPTFDDRIRTDDSNIKLTAEILQKNDDNIVVLIYFRDTFTTYDVSQIGIVIPVIGANKFNFGYFIKLNKASYVDGEFGNTYQITADDNCKLVGYMDTIDSEELYNSINKYYQASMKVELEKEKKNGKTNKSSGDYLNDLKNLTKKNIEDLRNLTKENFSKNRETMTNLENDMNKMYQNISNDFNIDLNEINLDFTSNNRKGTNSSNVNDPTKINPNEDFGFGSSDSKSKINYVKKSDYSKNSANEEDSYFKNNSSSRELPRDFINIRDDSFDISNIDNDEKYVSKIIYNNNFVNETLNVYQIFDMCDTSHDEDLGILNTLLKYKLEGFDVNTFDRNINVVNCGRCSREKCPINIYLQIMNKYGFENKEGLVLESEFYYDPNEKITEEEKKTINEIVGKLKKVDLLSVYGAELVLRNYLLKNSKRINVKANSENKKNKDKIEDFEIEYIDIDRLCLETPKLSLIKNLIDINNNEDYVKDYIVKEKIDIDGLIEGKQEKYSEIFDLNPYYLAAYIMYITKAKKINLGRLFEELHIDKLTEKASKELEKRNNDLAINRLLLDDKSKEELKKIVSFVTKYKDKQLDYIPFDMRLYTQNNDLILDVARFLITLFNDNKYIKNDGVHIESFYNIDSVDKLTAIYDLDGIGIVILKDFYAIKSIDKTEADRIINKLGELVNSNKGKIITIVVDGDKFRVDEAFSTNNYLKDKVFDIELNERKITEQEIYFKLLNKFEKAFTVDDKFKVLLLEYINETYNKSTVSHNEYMEALYERIILNSNKEVLKEEDIPKFDRNKTNEEIFNELNELVGLENIKEALTDLANLVEFKSKTKDNLKLKSTNLHMVFLGNPGTGKTTVARMIAGILYNLKYIRYNKFIEVSQKDLVAKYVGQTAPKTMEVIEKAMGGVLFIDEAYSLASSDSGEGSFNDECIATLIQAMENYRDDLVVIFAGYKKEMQDFLDSNSGIVSRIGYTLDFKDYTLEELILIFKQMVEKAGFKIKDDAIEKAKEIILEYKDTPNFGNARFVRALYEKSLIKHAKNMKDVDDQEKLSTIFKDDISNDNILNMEDYN